MSLFDRLSKNFMDQQFRRIDNVVWDMSSNKMGIVAKDESIATFDTERRQVSLNPLAVMSMPIPAYGQKVDAKSIEVGDIVVGTDGVAYGWVTEIKDDSARFVITKIDGSERKITPPNVNVIGFGEQSGLMVVKSLIGSTNGNADGIKNMMPLLMMSGLDSTDQDMDKMMQMMLMSSSMGGDSSNMMQTMLMMKMLGKV